MMWAIGNGESRSNVDVDLLQGYKVGCNAIFRDYEKIDHIICVDKRMMNEALESNANDYSKLYTRKDWYFRYQKSKKTRIVPDLPYAGSERPDDPFHWGSGPYAVLLAAKNTPDGTVNLLGFDLHSETSNVNNIYKDTPNYDSANKRAVDPRYWIHQIGKVFECFPNIQFTVYQTDSWQCPKSWKFSNVKVDNISNIYYNT